ncbi:MAG: 3-deoxy-manno-octulosonate cytidylyltransferase [Nitrospinaceae bacterium]|nr:MAG: 3-deoxy-manno-octulosonate cytidylyltransferase [Nitrospinaceae bacterium]
MIQWVVEQAEKAQSVSNVIVATDDERIFEAVKKFGGTAVMTSRDHASGTDRVAEVAKAQDCEIVVNVQGDEPLIPPENIDLIVPPLLEDASLNVSTLSIRITAVEEIADPNVCKVVMDHRGFALYFSRAPIPFDRDGWTQDLKEGESLWPKGSPMRAYKHIGLYAYRKDFLMAFSRLPASGLEAIEKLEQLRILENGTPIRVVETDKDSIGVDRKEDLAAVEKALSQISY